MPILSQIRLPSDLSNVSKLIESVIKCATEHGFATEKTTELEIAIEEVLVNIINYAYPKDTGDIKVTCKIDENSRFAIEIEDSGPCFDIHSAPLPDITSNVSNRKVGGLGIFLVMKFMSDVNYQRKNKKNILTLIP